MLIDTSGFLCFLDQRDFRHQKAVEHFRSARVRITHSFVLAELVALASTRNFPRETTLDFISDLCEDPSIEIVWVDEGLTEQAVSLLRNRKDKEWSLCDAVSFVLMEKNGIMDALTTDHHFEQARFVQILDS